MAKKLRNSVEPNKHLLRKEKYGRRGITLKPLSEGIRRDITQEELIESESLYRLIIYGGLKENVLQIAGIRKPKSMSLRRIYTGNKVYQAIVVSEEKETSVFAKEVGLQPDVMAVDLLRDALVVVPEVRNVHFLIPNGEWFEYGVMQDICEVDGVKNATSIRGLARNPDMLKLVKEKFEEFCLMLGRSLEMCRMLGIQDRSARNVFVIERTDGALAIGMIDLDLVACYPNDEHFKMSFGGQLYDLLTSLDFAFKYSGLVLNEPSRLEEAIEKDSQLMLRRYSLIKYISDSFIQGAEKCHEFYLEPENQDRIKSRFELHEGKPVGLALNEMQLEEREADIKPDINGKVQNLIMDGPNRGRFFFNWSDAWDSGFLAQQKEELSSFWQKSFNWALSGVNGTVVY